MEMKSVITEMEYNQERFTKRILFKKGESVMFVLNFMPGQALPTHTHPGSDVYVFVLEGTGTLMVDDRHQIITKGTAVHCSGEERFSFVNDGIENASLLVHLSKLPSEVYAKEV
ncbi:cupin domain-containing protein [Paenibacillus turpanensis]|uniref:cupin domain-containing protein n=1 Tax=Paenibacillus turpanensis TaxID=2689078 RepID=UPI0014079A99|nr:cupin domain-containing protein [Paenibacillus turpanensis]